MKNLKICKMEEFNALCFLRSNHAQNERVCISHADKWLCALLNDEVQGVIGILTVGKKTRIKGFFVRKESRKNGVGKMLLNEAVFDEKLTYTAFATSDSVRLFERDGFNPLSERNGITFLERKVK